MNGIFFLTKRWICDFVSIIPGHLIYLDSPPLQIRSEELKKYTFNCPAAIFWAVGEKSNLTGVDWGDDNGSCFIKDKWLFCGNPSPIFELLPISFEREESTKPVSLLPFAEKGVRKVNVVIPTFSDGVDGLCWMRRLSLWVKDYLLANSTLEKYSPAFTWHVFECTSCGR